MNSSAPPPNRALGPLLTTFIVAGLLFALYSIVFYVGPYRWFAELQIRWLDAYYVSITCVMTFVLCVGPGTVAARVLAAAGRIPADSAVLLLVTRPAGGLAARLGRARNWLIALGVGLTLIVLSVRDLVVAARGAKREEISASALESGAATHSTWLVVTGQLNWDASLETEDKHEKVSFVPVVSAGWTPAVKVGAVLRFRSSEPPDLALEAPAGTVDITGLPGMVRASFEDAGLDVDDALLIDFGRSPSEKSGPAYFLLGLGAVLMLLGGAGVLFRAR